MTPHQLSWTRALTLPELFDAVIQYMESENIHCLRLVNKMFLELCASYFYITLNVDNSKRYPDMKWILDRHYSVMETKQRRDPLDMIQSLRVFAGHSGYSTTDPRGLSTFLNRCRNLRHITIGDIGSDALPEKPWYPARLLWPEFINHGYRLTKGTPDFGHRDLMDERPWSNWDLLPLGGTSLVRLRTLRLEEGRRSPLNLDRFMGRLERSCAARNLSLFSITGDTDQGRRASFSVFQKCICRLKSLEILELSGIDIVDTDGSIGIGHFISAQEEHQQWILPKMKIFYFSCVLPVDIRLALFALVPNVEALTTNLSSLCAGIDQQLFLDDVDPSSWPTSPVPFPYLRKLDAPITDTQNWTNSRILHAWIQRNPRFELASLKDVRAVVDTLIPISVSVKIMQFYSRDQEWVSRVLASSLCRAMDDLEIGCENLDFAGVLIATCSLVGLVGSPQSFTQEEVFSRLPWSRTMTKLCFRTAIDSRLEAKPGEGSLELMRALLRLLPLLNHLEIKEGLKDLALFDGLGRAESASEETTG